MTGSEPPLDDRSSMSKAMAKATEVSTIAFMMVVPILIGYWIDVYLGTLPLCVIVGLVLGMSTGIWQLIKLVNRGSESVSTETFEQSSDESAE